MGHRDRLAVATMVALSLGACAAGSIDPTADSRHGTPPDTFHFRLDTPSFVDMAAASDGGGRRDGPRIDGPPARPDTRKPRPDSKPVVPDSRAPAPDTGCQGTIPGIGTAPFTLSFDSNNGGLTGTRDWQWGQLAFSAGSGCSSGIAPPTTGHSGRGVWGTVLNDCYNGLGNEANATSSGCSNVSRSDDSVLLLVFQIPSCYKRATLTYWEWTDYFSYFDWTEVLVNSKVVRTDCSSNYVKPTAWVKRTIDLTPYIGGKVTFEAHFMASSVVNYAGWYIDDVAVSVTR